MNLKEVNDLVHDIQKELEKEMFATLTMDEEGDEVFAVWAAGKGYKTAKIRIAKMNAKQIRTAIRRVVAAE